MIITLGEKKYETTITPIIVVENDSSVTIAKFILNGKEYIVKQTKNGKLIMN